MLESPGSTAPPHPHCARGFCNKGCILGLREVQQRWGCKSDAIRLMWMGFSANLHFFSGLRARLDPGVRQYSIYSTLSNLSEESLEKSFAEESCCELVETGLWSNMCFQFPQTIGIPWAGASTIVNILVPCAYNEARVSHISMIPEHDVWGPCIAMLC